MYARSSRDLVRGATRTGGYLGVHVGVRAEAMYGQPLLAVAHSDPLAPHPPSQRPAFRVSG
eukprot:3931675-Rhodomonas_salina.1